jgi:hypothetical protein
MTRRENPEGVLPPTRYVNLDAARARFGDRVDRLVRYFFEVDGPGDAAVESITALPQGHGWRVLNQALDHGVDSVRVPEPLRALFAQVDRVPAWVDWDLIRRAGELLRRAGPLGGIVLGAKSLVHGYASPAGNKPLVLSGRLREQAARRLNETARFVQAVTAKDGMRRHADGFKISLKVRLMHAQVRRMILASGKWNEAAWGKPINQHDLSATSLLFSESVVVGLRSLGVRISPEEADSYIHLWRYVGWLLGADPDLLPGNEVEALRMADLIGMTMGDPDDDSRALTRALMEAPLIEVRGESGKKWAERRANFGYAMARELLGDALGDKLKLPITAMRFLIPPIKGLVSAMEIVRELSPLAHRTAIEVGTQYWGRVVEIGLGGATYEFGLPQRLSFARG